MYLPLVGLVGAVSGLLQGVPEAVYLIAGILAYRTWILTPMFKNHEEMYRNDIRESPNYGVCYTNLAQLLMQKGQPKDWRPEHINEMAYLVAKSIALNPKAWICWMNNGAFLAYGRMWEDGLKATERAKELIIPLGGHEFVIKAIDAQIQMFKDQITKRDEGLAHSSSQPANQGEKR